jgi:hypothetical protein
MSGNTIGPTCHSHSKEEGGPLAGDRDTRASNGSGRTVELKDRPDSKLTPHHRLLLDLGGVLRLC